MTALERVYLRAAAVAVISVCLVGCTSTGRQSDGSYLIRLGPEMVEDVFDEQVRECELFYLQGAAFRPLSRVMAEGELQKLRLEILKQWDGRKVVAEYDDPDLLARVKAALETAERPSAVYGMPTGPGFFPRESRLVLFSHTWSAEIGITPEGFTAGDLAPADFCIFVSPELARLVDELCVRETGRHLRKEWLSALSSKPNFRELGGAGREWESVWQPAGEDWVDEGPGAFGSATLPLEDDDSPGALQKSSGPFGPPDAPDLRATEENGK